MEKNQKIILGLLVLIIGAVIAYFLMNKKSDTVKTTTTTTSGLSGLDLGSIIGALGGIREDKNPDLLTEINQDEDAWSMKGQNLAANFNG